MGSDDQRKSKKEEISKIKCDKNESYLWNPRLYYEKTICPLCPDKSEHKFKELTTPHFRKHLEQVHTLEEILSVMVCRLCHRHGVQNKKDMFLGLVADNDTQRHSDKAHPNQVTEFIQVYAKRNKQNKPETPVWGLEGGISKDPNKVYKYASRRPKSRVDSNKTNKSTEQSEQPTPIQPHKAQPVGNMVPQPFQQPLLLSNPVQSPQQPPQRNRPLIAPSAMRQIAPVQSQSHLLATPPHSAQSLVSPGMQQRQQPQEVQIANKLSMRPVLQLHQPQQQQQPIQHTLVQTPSLHYRVPMPVTTPTAAYPFDFPSSATTEISSYSPSPACPVVRAPP